MRDHTSRRKNPQPATPILRRKQQRIFRTVCIFQMLGILTCSGMLMTLWLMARLEASYEADEIRIFAGDRQPPEKRMDKEPENTLFRNPPSNPWSPPISKQQRQAFEDPKKLPQTMQNPMKLPRVKNQSTPETPLPPSASFSSLPPSLKYLGVMIDAGRHYFPLPWLYQQLEHFHDMGYNYIHFRLTDDQNFVLNLTIPDHFLEQPSTCKNKHNSSLAFVARRKQETDNLLDFLGNAERGTTTFAGGGESVVYQPKELAEFVRVAKRRYDITVIPEVNLPGHAGAWGASSCLPDLVVACPEFSCSVGYGVPLNLTHPMLPLLLKHVLSNVVDIFDRPPLLHLGGDELHMSAPCLDEAGIEDPPAWLHETVPEFEHRVLSPILRDLGYGPHQILRWENKKIPPPQQLKQQQQQQPNRFGGITHYWETTPSSAGTTVGQSYRQEPYVVSTGLYLDVVWYDRVYGYGDFQTAQKLVSEHQSNPALAIVVGTFELGMEFWEDRNVLGRLLAIRMGVETAATGASPKNAHVRSIVPRTQQDFKTAYAAKCTEIFSKEQHQPSIICEKGGWPLLEDRRFEAKWKWAWKEWKEGLCEYVVCFYEIEGTKLFFPISFLNFAFLLLFSFRFGIAILCAFTYALNQLQRGLTYPEQNIHIKSIAEFSGIQHTANDYYWDNVLSSFEPRDASVRTLVQNSTSSVLLSGSIPNVGIAIDLVKYPVSQKGFSELLLMVQPLGINLIQLSLANDFGQAVEFDSIPNVGYRPSSSESQQQMHENAGDGLYDRRQLEQMVKDAREAGVRLAPEVNLATNSGGWYKTGMLMDCPRVLCDTGRGIAFDIIQRMESVIPIALAAILELRDVFSVTGFQPFLHLGSDERDAVVDGCFLEAGHTTFESHSALNRFEMMLLESLVMVGIDPNHIIRWHNREKVIYPDRLGAITHYTNVSDAPKESERGLAAVPFFGTVLLKDEMTPWEVYRETSLWVANPITPRGVVAKTVDGQLPRFEQLIAFAMGFGLANEEKTLVFSPEEFQEDFELLCARFDCSSAIEKFGKAAGVRSAIAEATLVESSCTDRTIFDTQRKSRALLSLPVDLSS